MQKISSYLYPNRVQLLADLAGFTTEYTNVYQRTVKIYSGIDNTIEFDIKNADQKRIDLTTLSDIVMNVMDVSGAALPNSPYAVTPTVLPGIATVTIPSSDLDGLNDQYLKYSVSAVKDFNTIMLYADSRFGAVGTMQLDGSAIPTVRPAREFKSFTAEIDLKGNPIYHSSSIPTKFYEAVPTDTLSFDIQVNGFVGTIWLDAATSDTISSESWRQAGRPFGSWTWDGAPFSGSVPFAVAVPVGNYTYFRVSYQTPTVNGQAAIFNVTRTNGVYTSVTVNQGGTGYSMGAIIRIPGSVLGGVDNDNDLYVTVNAIEAGGSSYVVSSITSVSWQGTAAAGSGTYVVSGINYSGNVDTVVVS